jgi:hypothetical protein
MSSRWQSNLQSISRTIFSLKIVVCSLKSVKRLPGVFRLSGVFTTEESRSPVYSSPGSHFTDFREHTTIFKENIVLEMDWLPCDETPESRLLGYLKQAEEHVYKKTFGWQNGQGVKTPSVLVTGESRLHNVFCTISFFANKFRLTPWCIHHRGVWTLWWWIHWGVTIPQLWVHGESRLPCSINSSNIRENWKSFPACLICLEKAVLRINAGSQISWYCPFKSSIWYFYIVQAQLKGPSDKIFQCFFGCGVQIVCFNKHWCLIFLICPVFLASFLVVVNNTS